MNKQKAFEIASTSVELSFEDIGDFNLSSKLTEEDWQEVRLHILSNLANAFGIPEKK